MGQTNERKNPGTHQTWRHAIKQYQTDRDPCAPQATRRTPTGCNVYPAGRLN